MLPIEWEVLLLGCLTATACGIVGGLALLRKQALMGDALGHSLLAGIGAGFWLLGSSRSPWLFPCAVASGLFAIMLVEFLAKQLGGNQATALGLVFPAFFSIGIILISLAPKSAHIDLDRVVTGNLDLAPLDRLMVDGHDYGPRVAWSMALALGFIGFYLAAYWRHLHWILFDPAGAHAMGLKPDRALSILLLLTTCVITLAFETMGTVMVVSLLVAPGATAWLLSRNLTNYLLFTVAVSLGAALTGRFATLAIDASTTAATSCAALALFGTAFLLAPQEGLLARWRASIKIRERLDARLILVHLWHHEIRGDSEIECLASALTHHLNMPEVRLNKALNRLVKDQLAEKNGPLWQTTTAGTLLGRSLVEDDTGSRED